MIYTCFSPLIGQTIEHTFLLTNNPTYQAYKGIPRLHTECLVLRTEYGIDSHEDPLPVRRPVVAKPLGVGLGFLAMTGQVPPMEFHFFTHTYNPDFPFYSSFVHSILTLITGPSRMYDKKILQALVDHKV